MLNDMTEKGTTHDVAMHDDTVKLRKKPYVTPVLLHYGNIAKITNHRQTGPRVEGVPPNRLST